MQFQDETAVREFIRKKNTSALNTIYKTMTIAEDKTPPQKEALGLHKGRAQTPGVQINKALYLTPTSPNLY